MTTEEKPIRLPENFTDYDGEYLMSNCEHTIDEKVAEDIKGKPLAAFYAGWNFHGTCWWSAELSKWCCEVWCYRSYNETFVADTLKELMNDISDKYGWG